MTFKETAMINAAIFEDMMKANAAIKTISIKGKEYSPVQERITAFRRCYPQGFIRTELVKDENGVCTMRAEVGTGDLVLGTGTAQEKETSSYINKTSYIENCETSAVGRALGMAGFGIESSVASFEEVANAIQNQPESSQGGQKRRESKKADNSVTEPEKPRETASGGQIGANEWKVLKNLINQKGKDPADFLSVYGFTIEKPSEITGEEYARMLEDLR